MTDGISVKEKKKHLQLKKDVFLLDLLCVNKVSAFRNKMFCNMIFDIILF